MFNSGNRCPNCKATTLIRDVQTGEYGPGECANCRHDRSSELPGMKPGMVVSGEVNGVIKEVVSSTLPEGVKQLGGNWYELPNGEKVNGKKAMLAALGGEE